MKFTCFTLLTLITANIAFAEGGSFKAEGISTCSVTVNSKDPYCRKIVDSARAKAQINAEEFCLPKYPIQITDWEDELLSDWGPDVKRNKSSALFRCEDV